MAKPKYIVNKICCVNCKSEIRICNFEKHINGISCKKGGTFQSLIKHKSTNTTSNCKYCNSQKDTKQSLIQHEIRCKQNPDKILIKPSYGMLGKKGKNQYIKAKELNLPKPKLSEETIKKLSENSKNKLWTEEQKLNHSKIMRKIAANNPNSYSAGNQGRCKVYEIDGIMLKGTWEVKFYNWCKQNNIQIERPNTGFPYQWEGTRTYFPDFYLTKYDLYIEIKGYETDRDKAKWAYFPHKLTVIKNSEIKQIDNNQFNLESIL